jgi:hypothetical protein
VHSWQKKELQNFSVATDSGMNTIFSQALFVKIRVFVAEKRTTKFSVATDSGMNTIFPQGTIRENSCIRGRKKNNKI